MQAEDEIATPQRVLLLLLQWKQPACTPGQAGRHPLPTSGFPSALVPFSKVGIPSTRLYHLAFEHGDSLPPFPGQAAVRSQLLFPAQQDREGLLAAPHVMDGDCCSAGFYVPTSPQRSVLSKERKGLQTLPKPASKNICGCPGSLQTGSLLSAQQMTAATALASPSGTSICQHWHPSTNRGVC